MGAIAIVDCDAAPRSDASGELQKIMEAIGREIELWQTGVQTEGRAKVRIATLVKQGKMVARRLKVQAS